MRHKPTDESIGEARVGAEVDARDPAATARQRDRVFVSLGGLLSAAFRPQRLGLTDK
jgi:hypothetical protein